MEATSSPSSLNPLAAPFKSTRPAPLPAPPTVNEVIFHNLSTYPFEQDAEFQSGLSSILGHPATRASAEEAEQNADLVLKAQCFYFARQNKLSAPIDTSSYKSWLRLRDSTARLATHLSPSTAQDTLWPGLSASERAQQQPSPGPPPPPPPPTQSTTPLPSDPPPPTPPYPTTFNHIVDLITRNQPIPGIETIPNIVLGTASSTPNTVPARRKPWETLKDPQEAPLKDPLQDLQEASLKNLQEAPPAEQQPPPNGSSSSVEGRGGETGTTSTSTSTSASASASAKPKSKLLYGGLLGPLRRTEEAEEASSDMGKPVPVPTTTPSWQELAEEGAGAGTGAGAGGQVSQDGDAPTAAAAPAAHPA